jgi:hypothetical protein
MIGKTYRLFLEGDAYRNAVSFALKLGLVR